MMGTRPYGKLTYETGDGLVGCLHWVNGEHEATVEIKSTGGKGALLWLRCNRCGADIETLIRWDDMPIKGGF